MCVCVCVCVCVYIYDNAAAMFIQLCPTLCDPVDCSPPGSSYHGILQGRILEWVAMPSSKGSFRPRYLTRVSNSLAGRFFTISSMWYIPTPPIFP